MASSDTDIRSVLAFTVELAKHVGRMLENRPENLEISTKTSATDVVTHMDQLAEKVIVEAIQVQFPSDSIVGEEGTFLSGTSEYSWIIDPLDGTVNYTYDLPAWSISIARINQKTRMTQVGVVHAPALARTYWAAEGEKSWLEHNGVKKAVTVSDCEVLAQALVGTGFGYEYNRRAGQARVLNTVLPNVRDIRRLGSCAIDLCLVAEGVLDAFFERGVNPWDHSAGALIARQAGAIVSGLHGEHESDEMIVVANATLHKQLVQILETCEADKDEPAKEFQSL